MRVRSRISGKHAVGQNVTRIIAAQTRSALALLNAALLMRSRRHIPIILSALALAADTASTQESRIEQARQLDLLGAETVRPVDPIAPSSVRPNSGGDPDSFGIQQFLRDEERLRPFRIYADISTFVTSNVALARKDPLSDAFLIATFGFEYRRALPRGFQIDASLRVAAFRYDIFRQLDFSSVDAGVGVSYHSEKLGGIDLFARYGFNELISEGTGDVFFQNHTVLLGVQKAVSFSQAHYAYLGAVGLLGFADPVQSERSELSAYAGYHLQATRNLEADLVYRYAYLRYTEGDRADHNQTLSLGLRYRFTDWFHASASTYMSWNRSNQEVFNYDAANAGVGLTLSLQF